MFNDHLERLSFNRKSKTANRKPFIQPGAKPTGQDSRSPWGLVTEVVKRKQRLANVPEDGRPRKVGKPDAAGPWRTES